jgi:SAM-dependent methyltransferase
MAQVWRWELLDPLKARSQWPQAWLGFPYSEIEPNVLEMGRADFRQGYSDPRYGTLTPEDRVLLYCFMNLRGHYYESLLTFRDYDLSPVLSRDEPTLFVDLGSGPGTSGLAFAEYLSGSHVFDYCPVDLAPAMLDRAASLFAAARTRNLGKGSIGQYITSGDIPHRRIIFNASYLFASYTLDVTWIVDAVKQAMADADVVFFIYTNSTNPQAGQKWQQFCASLGIPDFATQATAEYLNNSYDITPKKRDFMRAVVRVK